MLNRWIEVWPEKLKPKYYVGSFAADNAEWWKNLNIQNYDGYWGGEVAAAKYTGYLKPAETTLYLPEGKQGKLFQEARLRKVTDQNVHTEGVVHVYRPFWPERTLNNELVHPILVYADLIATGDQRCLEAAEGIYDKYIAKYCRED